jgi:hypothetical protein
MLSPEERQRTWEGRYLAEMRANYYANLAITCRRRHAFVAWTALLLASGAVLGVIEHQPAWVAPVLSLVSAALTLYAHVAQHEKSGAECAEMANRQNRLAMDYERLWGSTYEENASIGLVGLEERRAQLSRDAIRLPIDLRRLSKWQDDGDDQRAIRTAI